MGTETTVEPLSDEYLTEMEEDFRAGRGCWSGDGLALIAEVRRARSLLPSGEPPERREGEGP